MTELLYWTHCLCFVVDGIFSFVYLPLLLEAVSLLGHIDDVSPHEEEERLESKGTCCGRGEGLTTCGRALQLCRISVEQERYVAAELRRLSFFASRPYYRPLNQHR